MFRLFRVLKEEGEDAVRRSVWLVCAAVLMLSAVGFAAAAAAIVMSHTMPVPAALLISAIGVLAIGMVCAYFADKEDTEPSSVKAPAASSFAPGLLTGGVMDRVTQNMLLDKVKTKPASVLAIAAAAGLAVAALDMFDDDQD